MHLPITRNLFVAGFVWSLLFVGNVHGTDNPLSAEFSKTMTALKDGVARLAAFRNEMAGELVDAPRDTFDNGCLVLTMAGAADDKDLTVYCLRRNGAWVWAVGSAQDWSPIFADGDATSLAVGAAELSGNLTVNLAPWGNKRRAFLERSVPTPARYKIEATGQLGRFTGSAILTNPTEAPHPSDPRELKGRWYPAGKAVVQDARPPVFINPLEEAIWFEQRGCDLYREIHAIAMQGEHGVPVAIGLEQGVAFRIRREPTATAPSSTVVEEDNDVDEPDEKPHQEPAQKSAPKPSPPKKPKSTLPSLDDVSVDDVLGDGGKGTGEDKPLLQVDVGPSLAVAALEAGKAVAHVERMLALVTAYKQDRATAKVSRGNVTAFDPEFGPWNGSLRLPEDAKGVAQLPDTAGAAGPNEWMHPTRWLTLGVWPQGPAIQPVSALPEFVPAFDALSVVPTNGFPLVHSEGGYEGINPRGWEEASADANSGVVDLPVYTRFTAYPVRGHDWGVFFAATELVSPKDGVVWVAMRARYSCSVRVNDRLVWESGPVQADGATPAIWTFQMPLVKGLNRVMARIETAQRTHSFSMRICTRGGPRPAPEAASAAAETAEAYKSVKSPYDGARQFRHDHTGVFPAANPPVAWDLEKNINVRWRKPTLENNGAMLVHGNCVFVWEEPFTLICLDRKDGSEQWRRNLDPLEVTDPKAHAAIQPMIVKARTLTGEDATKAWKEVDALYKKATGMAYREHHDKGFSGDAMSTPISDGTHVWVRISSKALACLKMDGTVRWKVATGGNGKAMGHPISSPVMVGRKIVLQVPTWPGNGVDLSEFRAALCDELAVVDEGPSKRRRQALRCYDADTGTLLWTSRQYKVPYYGNRYNADGVATPHVMRLTNGRETLDAIFTSGGQVFRLDDGETVLADAGITSMSATPVDDGRGRFFLHNGEYSGHSGAWGSMIAMQLRLVDRDHVEARQVWRSTVNGGCDIGGILDADARIYQFEGGHLWTVDGRTGRILSRRQDVFPYHPGHTYPPPVFAAGRIYQADDGRNGFNSGTAWAERDKPESEKSRLLSSVVSVVMPNDYPFVLARNLGPIVNGTTMSPVADGDELFVRFRNEVVCFGRTGDEGHRYEAEVVAQTLLQQIPLSPPQDDEVLVVSPMGPLGWGQPRPQLMEVGELMTDFKVLAAFPMAEADAIRQRLGFPHKDDWKDHDGRSAVVFGQHNSRSYNQDGRGRIHVGDGRFGLAYDLSKIHHQEPGTVSFWTVRKRVDRDCVLRLDAPGEHFKVYIGGVEIPHNRRVSLKRGNYLIGCQAIYPKDARGELGICPRFWTANDLATERAQHQATIRLMRPYLETATNLVPSTPAGKAAGILLSEK